MLTLITGTPGTGKTAYVVSELLELDGSRPVYVHAIPNLKLPHTQIYCRSTLCEPCRAYQANEDDLFVEEWNAWTPHGAILILDEVQRIWRPRGSGAHVPESVAALETHRHKGLDFFLISQGPHLFDSNVRRLVGRHVHLVSKWAGRYSYEWPECQGETGSTSGAVKRNYKLPKKVFHLYTSSTLHTVQNKKKPVAFYLIFPVIALFLAMSYKVYLRIHESINPQPNPTESLTNLSTSPPLPLIPSNSLLQPMNPSLPDFIPRQTNHPYTAPAYDGLYALRDAPLPTAAVYDGKKCKIFSRGGRPYPADHDFCVSFAKGEISIPYKKPDNQSS